MIKLISILLIILVVCSAGAFACYEAGKYFDKENNLEDCVDSGNPERVNNSIRCIGLSRVVFVQEITD